jgi:hypothetical protein
MSAATALLADPVQLLARREALTVPHVAVVSQSVSSGACPCSRSRSTGPAACSAVARPALPPNWKPSWVV